MSQTTTANSPYTTAADVTPSPIDDCVEARRRAEKTFYEVAQRRIADVDTSTDDVVTLAKAIAELKKHDAAMLRANAAKRLADARIESLNAAAEKKKEPNKPFDREAFVKVIRPAIRDIYGLNIDDDTDANDQAATRFSASSNSTWSSPAPRESASPPSAGNAAQPEISNFKSEINPPSPIPTDHVPLDPTAAQPPYPLPGAPSAGDYEYDYQVHSARFVPVAGPNRRHKKKGHRLIVGARLCSLTYQVRPSITARS